MPRCGTAHLKPVAEARENSVLHVDRTRLWVDEHLLSPNDLVAQQLHPRLEPRDLVAFLDANNLEPGLDFKLSLMTAIALSLVACQMRQLHHSDYCDDVLLKWMTMLALREFVVQLHPRLEPRDLVAFLDANNLEPGLDFKLSLMTAIALSLVACQMRQLHHSDYCDDVLLKWMTMLALREFVVVRSKEVQSCQHGDHASCRLFIPFRVRCT
ncbi:hypothetical protein PTSG_10932 [Salpingoeca rosetta]|uniref:Uncharacterized protein n=1 Tax=Salpingoeca rosetta (strain ATCC 50818 / BSB-021) TaxID=946362 RepID=F2URF3_SALR5|nr:uncharacterized protein PTSG_10932 [Salpingoeca rosetta]EGD80256.1 hypothetical protein PTSG_10932 [Salpingoeca rosetta]|eukprot:XP_004988318.1 hypothetical protein PTSG_10932 [Salpingoeca rosetta]